ncbi:putative RNA-directed DNA polymerase from transposon X-element [Trichonephila clavipes]|nr:putative RNA-directed DNA polymerase from transposon X-element [Trichonephila clavipes]
MLAIILSDLVIKCLLQEIYSITIDDVTGYFEKVLDAKRKAEIFGHHQLILEQGAASRNWRRATVIPFKKCGKTDGTPERFRPISLTSIACKKMEKMVLRRLTFHLHSHNLLQEEQSFSFFQGVPQGSILSSTLFSLYLSGTESVIKRKWEVGAFADDSVLWKSDFDLTKLERDINLVLEDIRNFTLDHKLTFNNTKSVVNFLATNRKLYNFQPIFLYNQPLTIDIHPKYLGFILDPEILGNRHIDNIVFKTRKLLNILRYISERDWGADAGTLRNTYISLIKPILEHGVPVYYSASVTNLQKLEKVHLRADLIITGLKNTCRRDIVLLEADLQPLSLRRRTCLTKYYNKLRSLDSRNRTSASKVGVITRHSEKQSLEPYSLF